MKRALIIALLCALGISACGPSFPDLEARIPEATRDAAYPRLIPLGPVLAEVDALLPRSAAQEGQGLEARAADLRRRAAQLRRMSMS